MAENPRRTCFDARVVQNYQLFLEKSEQRKTILDYFQKMLPDEFKRIGAGKRSLDVLGVGSGGGELDVEMLSMLQSVFPDVPITVDILEGSTEHINKFKALVAKSPNLEKIPFAWHIMASDEYETQVQATGDLKKFDFIHMIEMLYYVDDLDRTIKFFRSLLKDNGKILIVMDALDGGWDIMWEKYMKDIGSKCLTSYFTGRDVVAYVKSRGLPHDEHIIPCAADITDCFDPRSESGERLLDFMTDQHHFHRALAPEFRDGILDCLRNECSTEKDGRVLFDAQVSCILIPA